MSKAKFVALAIGVLYVVAAGFSGDEPMDLYTYFVATLAGLCLICFPDRLGSVTGVGASLARPGGVDTETPGCVVAALGWLFLLGVPVVYFGLK